MYGKSIARSSSFKLDYCNWQYFERSDGRVSDSWVHAQIDRRWSDCFLSKREQFDCWQSLWRMTTNFSYTGELVYSRASYISVTQEKYPRRVNLAVQEAMMWRLLLNSSSGDSIEVAKVRELEWGSLPERKRKEKKREEKKQNLCFLWGAGN